MVDYALYICVCSDCLVCVDIMIYVLIVWYMFVDCMVYVC